MASYVKGTAATIKEVYQCGKEMLGWKNEPTISFKVDNFNVNFEKGAIEKGAIEINQTTKNYYGSGSVDFAGVDSDDNNELSGSDTKAIEN